MFLQTWLPFVLFFGCKILVLGHIFWYKKDSWKDITRLVLFFSWDLYCHRLLFFLPFPYYTFLLSLIFPAAAQDLSPLCTLTKTRKVSHIFTFNLLGYDVSISKWIELQRRRSTGKVDFLSKRDFWLSVSFETPLTIFHRIWCFSIFPPSHCCSWGKWTTMTKTKRKREKKGSVVSKGLTQKKWIRTFSLVFSCVCNRREITEKRKVKRCVRN